MDELRSVIVDAASRSRAHGGGAYEFTDRVLPQEWQFIHIDVPTSPDYLRREDPATESQTGARYLSLADDGLNWSQVATRLWQVGGSRQADQMSGWLRRPATTDPPLSWAAGQERAIGRGMALNSAVNIRNSLNGAVGNLRSAQGILELERVAGLLDLPTSPKTAPLVVFVSSMCGGTGAGMVLDVARILATMGPELARDTCLFLYTPEVFDSLALQMRRGMEPNALALMGELLATSLGANDDEGRLLRELGIPGPDHLRTFRRVFPIVARDAFDARPGDGGMDSVYRWMGGALASLTWSPAALEEFVDFDLHNGSPAPTDLAWLGEGSPSADSVQWGSFGYARVSLGTDRYAEYVAQASARVVVDFLVEGTTPDSDPPAGSDAVTGSREAAQQLKAALGIHSNETAIGLLGRRGRAGQILADIDRNSRTKIHALLAGHSGLEDQALSTEQFLSMASTVVRRGRRTLRRAAKDEAYRLVYAWYLGFMDDLLALATQAVAERGLLTVGVVVRALGDVLIEWHTKLTAGCNLQWLEIFPLEDCLQSEFESLSDTRQGPTPEGSPLQELTGRLTDSMSRATTEHSARLLADVLEDCVPSFLEPLAMALEEQHSRLVNERTRPTHWPETEGLRAPNYAVWPVVGAPTPEHFLREDREVVIMNAHNFPAELLDHLPELRPAAADGQAAGAIAQSVLTGRDIDGGQAAVVGQHGQVIRMRSAWVPGTLTVDPQDRTTLKRRSVASFHIALTAHDVLALTRQWVLQDQGELGQFVRGGLGAYMDPSDSHFAMRQVALETKFATALQMALPRVSEHGDPADAAMQTAPSQHFSFSTVPFEDRSETSEVLRRVLSNQVDRSGAVIASLETALGGGNDIAHIDVFGRYAPMSPLDFSSLMSDLRQAWKRSVAEGSNAAEFFWANRRARPLAGCLAMSAAERKASVAGYVVGKITGRLRGRYLPSPNRDDRGLEVYSESEATWLSFPNPFLTPNITRPDYLVDELPALLESHVLAIVMAGSRTEHAWNPLLPYVELRHLFARIVQRWPQSDDVDSEGRSLDCATGEEYLRLWIRDGFRPRGSPPPDSGIGAAQIFDPLTSAGRREAALARCQRQSRKFAEMFKTDAPARNPYLAAFDRRPMVAALATDFVWAFDAVASLIRDM